MAKLLRNLEFADHNSVRRYPLAGTVTAKDVSGTFSLPDDFLVGLSLPVNWRMNVQPQRFLINRVTHSPAGITLFFGYHNGTSIQPVAKTVVPNTDSLQQYKQLPVVGLGEFGDSRGTLMIATLKSLRDQPVGDFAFDLAGAAIEPDCVRPDIRNVSGMRISSGNNTSELMTGVIRMAAGRNLRLTAELVDTGEWRVTLDAISGIGLTEACVCYTDLPPITNIGGQPPVGGRIDFIGNDCVDIVAANSAIAINDKCSQVCCGPDELLKLTSTLETFGPRLSTVENNLSKLDALITQINSMFLTSSLGDRGCQAP